MSLLEFGSAVVATEDPVSAAMLIETAQQIITVVTGADTPPPARLAATGQPANGRVKLQLAGTPGTSYIIQASTNLLEWTPIGVAVPRAGQTDAELRW